MVKVIKKRKGNMSIILFTMLIVFTLAINSMLILERKTVNIKRQNIHNAVVAANLASYYSIEQGDKYYVLGYKPNELQKYLQNPNTILDDRIPLSNIVNIMTSEYFKEGERYKSIFLNETTAYAYFNKYLQDNLGLRQDFIDPYTFFPSFDAPNKGDIKELKIKSFEVYNAIYKDISRINIPINVSNENRTYTGIHIDLIATINHDIEYGPIKESTNVPIHIDTEISLFRPYISN